jgi:DNA-binding SARP family transcriptional activator/adenylate kinase family enzyme
MPQCQATAAQQRIDIRLFGKPTVSAGGRSVGLSQRCNELLLTLLLADDGGSSYAEITARLWPELSDVGAMKRCRRLQLTLNRSLAPLLGGRAAISSGVYQLQIDRSLFAVDLLDLEAELSAVEQHAHHRLLRCDSCLDRLEQQITARPPATPFDHSRRSAPQFAAWIARRLGSVQLRLQPALQALVMRRLLQRNFPRAAELSAIWLKYCPTDEAALRARMLALAVSGRRAEALQLHQRAAQRRPAETGSVPAPATMTLAERIQHRAALLPPVPPLPPPPRLFGRSAQLAAAEQLLLQGRSRLLNIVGIGGVGKTTLARQLAVQLLPRFSDGITLLPAATISDSDALLSALAAALELPAAPQQPLLEQLCTWLSPRDQLIVIDNIEQIADVEQLLQQLLSRTQQPQLLVTSRRYLQLQHEVVIALEPWPTVAAAAWRDDPAIQLLLAQSGRSVQQEPEQHAGELQQLAALCGGLPLALELTARLIATQPYAAVITRLNDSLQSVTDGLRSVDSILSSSRQQLPGNSDQRVLSAIGGFHGPFSAALLQAVAAPFAAAPAVGAVLRFAVDFALLTIDADGRYRTHPLLQRLLAADLAAQPPLAAVVRESHARAYLELIARDGPTTINRNTLDWCRTHAEFSEDFLHAWQTAVALRLDDLLTRSTAPLLRFAGSRRLALRFDSLLQQALAEMLAAERQLLRRVLLAARLQLFMFHADYARLQPALDELIDAATPPDHELLYALRLAAERSADRGDLAGARRLIDRALAAGPPDADLQLTLARWHRRRGEVDAARPLLFAALAATRRERNQRNELAVLNELALLPIMQGDPAAALAPLQEAVALARTLGDAHVLATLLTNLAHARQEAGGDFAASLQELEEAVMLARSYGMQQNLRFAVAALGNACYRHGEYLRAYHALRETLLTDCREGFVPWTPEQLLYYVATCRSLRRTADSAALAAALQSLPTNDVDLIARRDALLAELPPFTALSAPISPAALRGLLQTDDDGLTPAD